MDRQAHITEVAELSAFRASLLVYLDKARRVLDDARQDVVATRLWLQSDRQVHWKHEIRRRANHLAQAEQELLSARLSGHPSAIQDRRRTVERARQAMAEAEQRLQGVKTWLRHYESQVESRLKAVTRLRQVLSHDMNRAVAFLDETGDILADYAGLSAGPRGPTPGSVAEPGGPPAGPSAEEGGTR